MGGEEAFVFEEFEEVGSCEGKGVVEGGEVFEVGEGEFVEVGGGFAWELRGEEGFGEVCCSGDMGEIGAEVVMGS